MPKFDNASIETAEMERQEWQNTKPQDQYAGRGKFTGCRECMSPDGMRDTDHETLKMLSREAIDAFAPWYEEPGNDRLLYYPCLYCNFDGGRVPDDLELLDVEDVLAWLDRDSMAPDYGALAEPEPVLASEDSRDSAGA